MGYRRSQKMQLMLQLLLLCWVEGMHAAITHRLTADSPLVRFSGRRHPHQDHTVQFDWPCVSFALNISAGSSVQVEMDGGGSRFSVTGCQEQYTVFETSRGVRNYTVCAAAASSTILQIRKVTEAGPMWGPIVKVLMPQTMARLEAVYVTG